MSIAQALKWAINKLKKKNNNLAILDAEALLAFVLKKSREYLYTYPEKNLTKKQYSKFQFLISQRIKGRPIPYLIGQHEFFGFNFIVNKNVLIPRPETETLVEEAIKQITQLPKYLSNQLTILDLGTGSGCIAIALAKNLPNIKIVATDISQNALKVAKKNAIKHNVSKQIKFIQGDLLQPFLKMSLQCRDRSRPVHLKRTGQCPVPTRIIIANLPYLTKKQLKNVLFEPKTALYGGRDGLKYYQKLIKQIRQFIPSRDRSRPVHLKRTGQCSVPTNSNIIIFLEIAPEQTKPIKAIIKKYLPHKKISFIKDLSGKNRVVKIK